MGSPTDCTKEKLERIDSVVSIGNRSSPRHIFILIQLVEPLCELAFFHFIGAVCTLNSFVRKSFYHLLHRFCENVITLIVVLIFTMKEFVCLLCENYNDRNMTDNSHILAYFYVLSGSLSPILFYFFLKNEAITVQYLPSGLVWNKNNCAEWGTLLQASNPNSTNSNNNANDTYNVLRGVSTTCGMESDANGDAEAVRHIEKSERPNDPNNNPTKHLQHHNDSICVTVVLIIP